MFEIVYIIPHLRERKIVKQRWNKLARVFLRLSDTEKSPQDTKKIYTKTSISFSSSPPYILAVFVTLTNVKAVLA